MKNLTNSIKVFVFVILAFTVASCTDLTEAPYDEVTQENFNPEQEDIPSLIAPAYTNLRGMWMQWGYIDVQGEPSDIFVTPRRPDGWYDGGIYVRFHTHTWDETQRDVAGLWDNLYSGINAINRVIYQVESGQVPIDESLQADLFAELKTFRAFYYYKLLDNFGNVPIVTDYSSEEVPEQSSRQEVYDFVVQELTENIPNLTEEVNESTYSRINKWAGYSILAEVYLNAEVYTGTPQWDQVIEITNETINSGHYQLEDNYLDNFNRNNTESSENIWVIPYDEVNAPGNQYHMKHGKTEFNQGYNIQASPWGGSSAIPQFINSYVEDDTRLEDTWISGPLEDDDGNVLIDIVKNIPAQNSDETEDANGYSLGKYEVYEGMTDQSDVDVPIYRYARVLMMKAEALLRTGSPNEAANIVTQIRQRAFEDSDPSEAVVTGSELQGGSTYNYGWWDGQNERVVASEGSIQVVTDGGANIQYGRFLDELAWEFAVEGPRRQDLIRFGVYTTETWFNHTPNGEYRELYPIPLGALEDNTNLEQNPGY